MLIGVFPAGSAQRNETEPAFSPKSRNTYQGTRCARSISETVILGVAQGHPGGVIALSGNGNERPMLGRYRVERELGKGAMGVVYLGKDAENGRLAAIKARALSPVLASGELRDIKQHFFHEAETAGRLRHPNIVTVFNAGEDRNLVYIAMEFLRDGDLTPFIRPGKLLPLPRVLSIIARVAGALSCVHANNVVHRDIKPANIMCELESDTVKLADFGIAHVADSSGTDGVLGTPSYMSPEQLSGQALDARSDLFSLGVTLYQLCCGSLPFRGDSMAQLMFNIANEPHADILACNPALPPVMVEIAGKALAKQPEHRYQSANDMAQALHLGMASVASSGKTGAGMHL